MLTGPLTTPITVLYILSCAPVAKRCVFITPTYFLMQHTIALSFEDKSNALLNRGPKKVPLPSRLTPSHKPDAVS